MISYFARHLKMLVATAAAVGFGLTGLAPNVLGQQDPAPQSAHSGGPATARTLVASGTSREYGRWELLTSSTADGTPCLGVRLLDRHGALSEGCGTAVENQVGTISGDKGTLFFGRVTARARSVQVRDGGAQRATLRTIAGSDHRTYVLDSVAERLPRAEISLRDGNGRDLGRVDPAAAAR